MSAGNQLAVYLPFVLTVLLAGSALMGSRMTPSRRMRFERYLLIPLTLVMMAIILKRFVYEHNWLLLSIWVMAALLVFARLYSRVRPAAPNGVA